MPPVSERQLPQPPVTPFTPLQNFLVGGDLPFRLFAAQSAVDMGFAIISSAAKKSKTVIHKTRRVTSGLPAAAPWDRPAHTGLVALPNRPALTLILVSRGPLVTVPGAVETVAEVAGRAETVKRVNRAAL